MSGLRNLWDNIMGIPKENIISKALRTYLEKKMTQNIPNQVKKKRHTSPESVESPKEDGPKEACTNTYHN